MSETINCHYIARTLTKPWEAAGRELHFFDFATGKFDHMSSKNLFARERLFDDATEKHLNKLIESPFAQARKRILQGHNEARNWAEYRALILMLVLQGVRSSAALTSRAHAVPLSTLLGMTEPQINTLALEWMRGQRLLRYGIPRGERLLFPGTGVFPIPVFDAAGDIAIACAIPIHPRVFVACVPDGGDFETLPRAAIHGSYYSTLSVGLTAELVVVPSPDRIESNGAAPLREWRETARRDLRLWEAARDANDRMFQLHGIKANLRARVTLKLTRAQQQPATP